MYTNMNKKNFVLCVFFLSVLGCTQLPARESADAGMGDFPQPMTQEGKETVFSASFDKKEVEKVARSVSDWQIEAFGSNPY